jgi:hypothetical protein
MLTVSLFWELNQSEKSPGLTSVPPKWGRGCCRDKHAKASPTGLNLLIELRVGLVSDQSDGIRGSVWIGGKATADVPLFAPHLIENAISALFS